jgi:hypothetical protein
MMELTKVLGHSDPRDINPRDIRTITTKNNFAGFFEEDPFGIIVPSSAHLQDTSANR